MRSHAPRSAMLALGLVSLTGLINACGSRASERASLTEHVRLFVEASTSTDYSREVYHRIRELLDKRPPGSGVRLVLVAEGPSLAHVIGSASAPRAALAIRVLAALARSAGAEPWPQDLKEVVAAAMIGRAPPDTATVFEDALIAAIWTSNDRLLTRLLSHGLRSSSEELIFDAIAAVPSLAQPSEDVVGHLVKVIDGPGASWLKGMAATALVEMKPPAYACLLSLLSSSHPKSRARAARALTHTEGREALPKLLALTADDSAEVRSAALGALWVLRGVSDAALEAVIAGLSDRDGSVAHECVLLLREDPVPEAAGPLAALLKRADAELFIDAALTLGALGTPAAEAIPVLKARLNDADPRHETAIVRSMVRICPRERARFEATLASSSSSEDRRLAALALGNVGIPASSLSALQVALEDPVDEVVLAAVSSLELLPVLPRQVRASLERIAQDVGRTTRLREGAREALAAH